MGKDGENLLSAVNMTIIPLGMTAQWSNCPSRWCTCIWLNNVSYGERHFITTPIVFSNRSNVILPQFEQITIKLRLASNLNPANALVSAWGYNDTHVLDHANPVQLIWEFTVCREAPRHLLHLAKKISSVFFWATRRRVGSTHSTSCDHDELEA